MRSKKAYVIILVTAFIAIIGLVAWVLIDLGCGEIMQTRARNDFIARYYVALAGTEFMYAKLKSQEGGVVTWPQTVSQTSVKTLPSGGTTVGSFRASANTITSTRFGVVAESYPLDDRRAIVNVKYGMNSPFTNFYPVGAAGNMSLSGHKWLIFRSWVRAEGPIVSGGGITTNNYVQVSGDQLENQTFQPADFWYRWNGSEMVSKSKVPLSSGGYAGDVNGDGNYLNDVNEDGRVTIDDAGGNPDLVAIFNADNTVADIEINDKDAFYAYYTVELNNKENLQIGPGQANYYNGNQEFGPWGVPDGTPIIFVNGTADILFSDTNWWGGAIDHTIVAMDDITIVQPTNGSDDTLTLVSYGDVDTGGVNFLAEIRGNMIVYAHGDFGAWYGGTSNGAIYTEGDIDVDTIYPVPGLLNRDINKGTKDYLDPANRPLGFPPDVGTITLDFNILNEMMDPPEGYKPKVQRQ